MTRVSASSGTRMLRGVDNDNRRFPKRSKIELYLDKKSCSVSFACHCRHVDVSGDRLATSPHRRMILTQRGN